jgi:hypothetical protein
MVKTQCIKDFPCEQCGKLGLLQILTANYARCRHYSHLDANSRKPQFIYHRNSIAYVTEKLKGSSEKSLSSRMKTEVVAVSSKDGSDQIGHESNIDQKLQANSSKLENMRCRGSLAWLGRQTHNLEFARGKRPQPEVAGSNPAPGTTQFKNCFPSSFRKLLCGF